MFKLFRQDQSGGNLKNARTGVIKAKRRDKTLSHPAFKALVVLNIVGAIVAGYLYVNREKNPLERASERERSYYEETASQINRQVSQVQQPVTRIKEEKTAAAGIPEIPKQNVAIQPQLSRRADPLSTVHVTAPATEKDPLPSRVQKPEAKALTDKQVVQQGSEEDNQPDTRINENITYTVAGPQVYFHNKPDERTRRNAFINRWNKAVLKPLDEQNGFVYIVYTNNYGQTSRGWMLKKHLKPLN